MAGSSVRDSAAVTIAVATFHRNAQLAALLPQLAVQAAQVTPAAEILIIDNDPAAGAADVVAGAQLARYVHEPLPGLAAVRNRALAECRTRLLVFIDDDETPEDGWLSELLAAWQRWDCAAVAGPVLSRFESEPAAWLRATGVFDRSRPKSGTMLQTRGAGNLLLDLDRVRAAALHFDERFALTGGEDTMFTRCLTHRGETLRWCDEAVAVETVPADRIQTGWVFRRAFRAGTITSRVELGLAGDGARTLIVRVSLAARALVRIALATGQLLAGFVRLQPGRRARASFEIVSCTGMLLGAAGIGSIGYGRRR